MQEEPGTQLTGHSPTGKGNDFCRFSLTDKAVSPSQSQTRVRGLWCWRKETRPCSGTAQGAEGTIDLEEAGLGGHCFSFPWCRAEPGLGGGEDGHFRYKFKDRSSPNQDRIHTPSSGSMQS
ncbi:hypothetical protein CapIbe_016694 [Capra ibex]